MSVLGTGILRFSKREFAMKSLMKWIGTAAMVVLMAGAATAADTLIAGKVKSVDAERKEFVLVDGREKDQTIKFGDEVVIHREGKEVASGLKPGDLVTVCYHRGTLTWTAHYILVKAGDTKDFNLMRGSFKSYDAEKKTFTYTDADGKDWTYALNGSKVRLNMVASTIQDIKIGDTILAVIDGNGEKRTLQDLMVSRKS